VKRRGRRSTGMGGAAFAAVAARNLLPQQTYHNL
jgi:hypothetical protein